MPCWVCDVKGGFAPKLIDSIPEKELSESTQLTSLPIPPGAQPINYLVGLENKARSLGLKALLSGAGYKLYGCLSADGSQLLLREWTPQKK
jgi:hypothetical protein